MRIQAIAGLMLNLKIDKNARSLDTKYIKKISPDGVLLIDAKLLLSLGPNLYNGYVFTTRLVIPSSWPVKIELADALFSNFLPLEH